MKVHKEKCTGCRACHPYCPIGAISLVAWENGKRSEVKQSDCTECAACLRSGVCPTDAIFMPELEWPRSIRPRFSSPHAAPLPGLKGAPPPPDPKLNDVTGRISQDSTAVVVEVGRPGVSTSLRDVEKICMALAASGVVFDPGSGVTGLMIDPTVGKLQPDVLSERVLHVMVHYSCANDRLLASLRALKDVSDQVSTVFSVGFSNLLNEKGTGPAISIAGEAGFTVKPHAKTNVGLCRSGVLSNEP